MNFDMTPEPTVVTQPNGPVTFDEVPMPPGSGWRRIRPPTAPHHNPNTSYGRYFTRLRRWQRKHPKTGFVRHLGWWWLHNVIVHPLIGYLPLGPLFALHDWTSKRLNLNPQT